MTEIEQKLLRIAAEETNLSPDRVVYEIENPDWSRDAWAIAVTRSIETNWNDLPFASKLVAFICASHRADDYSPGSEY